MERSNHYADENVTVEHRQAALYTQINSILDSIDERVRTLEIEDQATDLQGFPVDRLERLAERVNALAKEYKDSTILDARPANLTQLKRTLQRLLNAVGHLEAERYEPFPLPDELREFRIVALGQRDRGLRDRLREKRYGLANRRYVGAWGNYDPQKPQRSSWRVREANRYLTELEHRDDRRPGWIAIWFAFAAAVISVSVAFLAIPTEKSIYCRYFSCSEPASLSAKP